MWDAHRQTVEQPFQAVETEIQYASPDHASASAGP